MEIFGFCLSIGALILAVIAAAIVVYDFRARAKAITDLLLAELTLKETTVRIASSNNDLVKTFKAFGDRLEVVETRSSATASAMTQNRRI